MSLPGLFRNQNKIFPTTTCSGPKWASVNDLILVNDDYDCSDLFKDVSSIPSIHFINFGYDDPDAPLTESEKEEANDPKKIWKNKRENDLLHQFQRNVPGHRVPDPSLVAAHCVRETNSIRPLFDLLGVRRLSSHVNQIVRPQNSRCEHSEWYNVLVDACAVIQRWIFSKEPDIYNELTNYKLATNLLQLETVTVDDIILEYQLQLQEPAIDITRTKTVLCHFESGDGKEPGRMYVSSRLLEDDGSCDMQLIWKSFVQAFASRPSQCKRYDALVKLLVDWQAMSNPNNRSRFLERREIPELPDEAGPPWVILLPNESAQPQPNRMPTESTISRSTSLTEDLETFSGGFDKPRKPRSNQAKQSQFPAPQHLEVVVAEEDSRVHGVGASATTEGTISNVVAMPANHLPGGGRAETDDSENQKEWGFSSERALIEQSNITELPSDNLPDRTCAASGDDMDSGSSAEQTVNAANQPEYTSVLRETTSLLESTEAVDMTNVRNGRDLVITGSESRVDHIVPYHRDVDAPTFGNSNGIGVIDRNGIKNDGFVLRGDHDATESVLANFTVLTTEVTGVDYREELLPLQANVSASAFSLAVGRLGERTAYQELLQFKVTGKLCNLYPFKKFSRTGSWKITWIVSVLPLPPDYVYFVSVAVSNIKLWVNYL